MNIVAGGDSFIYGSELKDQDKCYSNTGISELTFTALLAKEYNLSYVCAAFPGNSNGAIARLVMNACETLDKSDTIVFVMWTFPGRFEFRFNYFTGRRTTPWHSVNAWDVAEGVSELEQHFHNQDTEVSKIFERNAVIMNRTGISAFAKEFYKHVGDNEIYELYTTLKEVVLLQNYLISNNIPYLFTTADAPFRTCITPRHMAEEVSLKSLYDQIVWDNWFEFPEGTAPGDTLSPRGFYQWAIENKYPVGTTHPLEEAHEGAAELLKDKFNELVKKSIQQN